MHAEDSANSFLNLHYELPDGGVSSIQPSYSLNRYYFIFRANITCGMAAGSHHYKVLIACTVEWLGCVQKVKCYSRRVQIL